MRTRRLVGALVCLALTPAAQIFGWSLAGCKGRRRSVHEEDETRPSILLRPVASKP